jgi:uncharacterized protein
LHACCPGRLYGLVTSEPIIHELRDKLVEKFGHTPEEAEEVGRGLRLMGRVVPLAGRGGWILADASDDKFIETALVGKAEIIVSGDRHLLAAREVEGVRILSPRQFLDMLGQAP